MKNFSSIIKIIESQLPLKLKKVEITGEQFLLHGENWGGVGLTTSSWRLLKEGQIIYSSEEYDSEIIKELSSLSIISIEPQSKFIKCDLAFHFSNFMILETFSTLALEPWNILINNKHFYGDPFNKDWAI